MTRRLAREKALQALFQVDVGKIDPQYALASVLEDGSLSGRDSSYARVLFFGALEKVKEIDEIISRHTVGWSLERLASIDKNVLRLAIYELLYVPEVPAAACINEAVELTKIFHGERSARFVNALLDRVKTDIRNKRGGG